jgi:serine/threonine protein kinase/tetratricopeptide (TPR) repeat protein
MNEDTSLIAGRYRLDMLIGRGGMGDVYRGTDTQTGALVAIKRLHEAIIQDNPDIVDRFRREGEALRRLNHPSIVTVLDTVEENGKHYLVMEYVSGGSLRDLIDEQARLPLEGVLNVALDLADALTRAHRLNIIHRDIKPDNVLLAEDSTPRLTDFGVAHLGDKTRLTQTGSVIGTYAYLSPEACNGLDLDERTDIWSFGVMLFEMLTGRVPFQGAGTAAMLTAILTKPAPDLTRLRPGTPPPLVSLVQRMLEKDRERRISSVRLVGAELEALIRGLDTPLRDLLVATSHESVGESRFSTPSDEIPAMAQSAGDQTHGFSSLYPSPDQAVGVVITPSGTRLTAEVAPAANKWQWIALMVIVTVLACAVVAVVAIALGPDRGDSGEKPPPPTQQASPPPATPPPVAMEPVGPGEYMVLVADLEPIGVEPRDVSRFIADDLTQTLEIGVPFSTIGIRRYKAQITSNEDAQSVAADTNATVIVWGNYDADAIELEVQVGATTAFKHLAFERDLVDRTANVRLRLTDERRESIALAVLGVLNTLQSADGDGYESLRSSAIGQALDVTSAEIVGNTVAARVHRANLAATPTEGLDQVTAAVALDAGNPLLYSQRAMFEQRLGLFEDAKTDALTAQRIGPPGWALPNLILATLADDESVLDLFDQVIAMRPDDWFAYFWRGVIYYENSAFIPNGYTLARADLEQAIALGPNASFPYIYAALLALREGRMTDAGAAIHVVLTEFPDPDFMGRLIDAMFGGQVLTPFALKLAAFTNQTLGRHAAVIADTQQGLESFGEQADLYLLQGVSYCASGDYAAAETDFSKGMAVDASFALLYLLRADTLLRQGNESGAQADFDAITQGPLGDTFRPYIDAVETGNMGCATLFSPDNPMLAAAPSADAGAEPTPSAYDLPPEALAAVKPVEPGEYMVLVAQLEPFVDAQRRDVARFIADDLQRALEESVPYSNIRVRQYPAILTSADEARQVAAATGATVIVWGIYDQDTTEIEVQIGATTEFPHIAFARATLEATANARVRMTNERRESVALPVMGVINLLSLADGGQYEFLLSLTIIDALDAQNAAEIVGHDVAAHVHRALALYTDDAPHALSEFDNALALDRRSPLLYAYRSIARLRAGAPTLAGVDMQTAARLGPTDWTTPLYFIGGDTLEDTLAVYDSIITLRPDDWFAYFMKGIMLYLDMGDFAQARSLLEQSIALEPDTNLPYITAMLLALREGRIADAQAFARVILTEFPDPELTNRAFNALYGELREHEEFTGPYFSMATNAVLGQYARVTEEMEIVDAALAGLPGLQDPITLSDLRFLQGIAYCNLADYGQAEAAYTEAISDSPDYALLYALRGQIRRNLSADDAQADFEMAQAHDPGAAFDPWLAAAVVGDWTCENFFDYALMEQATGDE